MNKPRNIMHLSYLLPVLSYKGFLKWMPDKRFLKMIYKSIFEKTLNLDNPKTYSEKLQWIKLYDHNPLYTKMVDKHLVKEYVSKKIGNQYIIPTYGIWTKFDDIDFDSLPNSFVVKCTHDSGGLAICKDKATFDFLKAKKRINQCFKRNFFWFGREWPYKEVQPKIIAEKFMIDKKGELLDYKFFCFNGKVKFFKIDFNRFTRHQANYFDRDKHLLPFGEANFPPDPFHSLEIPEKIDQMMNLAEKLSEGIPFVRIDLYYIDGLIYFGEFTFFPASGFGKFIPEEWDSILGNFLELPKEKKL